MGPPVRWSGGYEGKFLLEEVVLFAAPNCSDSNSFTLYGDVYIDSSFYSSENGSQYEGGSVTWEITFYRKDTQRQARRHKDT